LDYLDLSSNQLEGNVPSSLTNLVGLVGLDLGCNKLSASDPVVIEFLDVKDPDWAQTQTVPPDGIWVIQAAAERLRLAWTPISYTWNGGYYEVYWANGPAGPFALDGRTAAKTVNAYAVDGLAAGTTYYFYVRTYTPAHGSQQNELWSAPTAIISVTTASLPQAPEAAFDAAPTSDLAPLAVEFNDQSSGDYTDRAWDFGDGATGEACNMQHTYLVMGTYSVTLTVSGPYGEDTLVRTGYITVVGVRVFLPLVKR